MEHRPRQDRFLVHTSDDQPGQNWSGQYSYAKIKSPGAPYPLEVQERMTPSPEVTVRPCPSDLTLGILGFFRDNEEEELFLR